MNTPLNSRTEICQNIHKQCQKAMAPNTRYVHVLFDCKYLKILQSTMYNIMHNKKQSSAKHAVTMVKHTLYCSTDMYHALNQDNVLCGSLSMAN